MLHFFMPFVFMVMAAFFLSIGLAVIIRRRPLLLTSRIFLLLILIAFTPQFIDTVLIMQKFEGGQMPQAMLVTPIIILCVITFFFIQMKGYMLIGVHDDTFRSALLHALNKNSITFEERLSSVALLNDHNELQVAIQSWVGAGQLKMKKRGGDKLLTRLVKGINEYYAATPTKPNLVTAIFYTVIGILMGVVSIVIFQLAAT